MNLLLSTYDYFVQKNIELADQESELINLNKNLHRQVEERKKEQSLRQERRNEVIEWAKKYFLDRDSPDWVDDNFLSIG